MVHGIRSISIGSGSADKAGDILICRRMKLRGMRWCREKADSGKSRQCFEYTNPGT